MSVEISRKIAEFLDLKIGEEDVGRPCFASPEYELFSFPPTSFISIKDVQPDMRMAFVDGGNQELLGAPNFSVQMNRVYFNILAGKQRIAPRSVSRKIEFYSVTTSSFRNGEIFYDTRVFPLKDEFADKLPDERHLCFSSRDRTIVLGNRRADIKLVSTMARRFAEWEFSKHIVEKELEPGDLIVHDGSLQTSHTNEQTYTSRAFEAAVEKNVVFVGLSKTSTLLTTTGLSLLGAAQKLAEDCGVKGPWCLPIAKVVKLEHNAFIYVVKLHEKSRYVFRCEIYGEQARKMNDEELCRVSSALANNSKDISFLGYPYGLVDADSFARVGENEIGKYRMLLLSEISRIGKLRKFSRHVCSGDAHSVLDGMKS